MNKMNIVVRKNSLAPCSFNDVKLGQVFYKAEDANKEDKNFYVKVDTDECTALDLRSYYVLEFPYDMQVFPVKSVKSDLLIDISKNA